MNIQRELGYNAGFPNSWRARTVGANRVLLSTPGTISPPQLNCEGWRVSNYRVGFTNDRPGEDDLALSEHRIYLAPYKKWHGGDELPSWLVGPLNNWRAKNAAFIRGVTGGVVSNSICWGKWEGGVEPSAYFDFTASQYAARWIASWLCLHGGEEQEAVLLVTCDRFGDHTRQAANWDSSEYASRFNGQSYTYAPCFDGGWLCDLITQPEAKGITQLPQPYLRHIFELERREAQ